LILLARLYRAEGDAEAFARVRDRLQRQFGENAPALTYLTRAALRAENFDDADRHLAGLERVAGQRFETLALRFQWRALAGGRRGDRPAQRAGRAAAGPGRRADAGRAGPAERRLGRAAADPGGLLRPGRPDRGGCRRLPPGAGQRPGELDRAQQFGLDLVLRS